MANNQHNCVMDNSMELDSAATSKQDQPTTTVFVRTWLPGSEPDADYADKVASPQLQLEFVQDENKNLNEQVATLRSLRSDNKITLAQNSLLITALKKDNKRQDSLLLKLRQDITRHKEYEVSTELWFDIKINQVKSRDRTIKHLTQLEEKNRKQQRDIILSTRRDSNLAV
jgi:hypothetical protein